MIYMRLRCPTFVSRVHLQGICCANTTGSSTNVCPWRWYSWPLGSIFLGCVFWSYHIGYYWTLIGKSSILIWVSNVNHPFGVPSFMETPKIGILNMPLNIPLNHNQRETGWQHPAHQEKPPHTFKNKYTTTCRGAPCSNTESLSDYWWLLDLLASVDYLLASI